MRGNRRSRGGAKRMATQNKMACRARTENGIMDHLLRRKFGIVKDVSVYLCRVSLPNLFARVNTCSCHSFGKRGYSEEEPTLTLRDSTRSQQKKYKRATTLGKKIFKKRTSNVGNRKGRKSQASSAKGQGLENTSSKDTESGMTGFISELSWYRERDESMRAEKIRRLKERLKEKEEVLRDLKKMKP